MIKFKSGLLIILLMRQTPLCTTYSRRVCNFAISVGNSNYFSILDFTVLSRLKNAPAQGRSILVGVTGFKLTILMCSLIC